MDWSYVGGHGNSHLTIVRDPPGCHWDDNQVKDKVVTKWEGDKVTMWQSDGVTKWRGYKVTRLQSDGVTKWRGYKVTGWQSDKKTKWRGDKAYHAMYVDLSN